MRAIGVPFENEKEAPRGQCSSRKMTSSSICENELPVGEPLEVSVIRVDRDDKCVFVRPIDRQHLYDQLVVDLREAVSKKANSQLLSDAIRENLLYAAVMQEGNFRVVLVDKEPDNSSFKMLAIDVGETLRVNASQLRSELPRSVRTPPPMCIRVNPELGVRQQDSEYFASLRTGMTCMIEISDIFFADYPQLMKELYPPEVSARIYKKDAKIAPSQWMVVSYRRSRPRFGVSCGTGGGGSGQQPFRFKDFAVTLPHQMSARVTKRISFDTYIMRDKALLCTVYDHIERPRWRLDTSICDEEGVGCLVRTMREFDVNKGFRRPRLYRGLAMPCDGVVDRCMVSLIDYAEVVECETKMVFDLSNQPQIVRDLPAAAFKFRAKKVDCPWKTDKRTSRLHEEKTYEVELQGKDGRGVFFGNAKFLQHKVNKELSPVDDDETSSLDDGHNEEEEDLNLTEKEEELKRRMQELREEQESFKHERQLYELEAEEREKQMRLMAAQMQLLEVSHKMDTIFSQPPRVLSGSCTSVPNEWMPTLDQPPPPSDSQFAVHLPAPSLRFPNPPNSLVTDAKNPVLDQLHFRSCDRQQVPCQSVENNALQVSNNSMATIPPPPGLVRHPCNISPAYNIIPSSMPLQNPLFSATAGVPSQAPTIKYPPPIQQPSLSHISEMMSSALMHSQQSRVQHAGSQSQIADNSIGQAAQHSVHLPPFQYPNTLPHIGALQSHMQMAPQNVAIQSGWNPPSSTSAFENPLTVAMMHRLPYTVQQPYGGLRSALAANTFLPMESLQTASATPYHSSYCMPRVSVPMPSSLPEERVYPLQQPLSAVEVQEQAYRVPEGHRVVGSTLDGAVSGTFYSKTSRDVLDKTAAMSAVELQQTVEFLKAQIDRLRVHCAALEAKAGGDAAGRVPKQNDGWTGPLLNETARPSQRDGDGSFDEMRQASHHDGEKKRSTGGSPLNSNHVGVGLRGSTGDEIGSSVEESIMHGAERTESSDEDNGNLVKLYQNCRM
uniref:Tudor domain-containing protein n=2 Tax=Parascaris univalens TaxID=6257 RepID=A0A915CE11_PARUN